MLSIHLIFVTVVSVTGRCIAVSVALQIVQGRGGTTTMTTLLLKGGIVHVENSQDFSWATGLSGGLAESEGNQSPVHKSFTQYQLCPTKPGNQQYEDWG